MNPPVESNDLMSAGPVQEIAPVARPIKPRVWTSFVGFVAAAVAGQIACLAAMIMLYCVAGFVVGFQKGDPATITTTVQTMLKTPLIALLVSLVPFQLGMISVVLVAAVLSYEPFKTRIGYLPQTGRKFGTLKLATMAGVTLSIALASVIATSVFLGPPSANNSVSAAIIDGSWWSITLLSVLLSVIPALVEETVFRGFLQRRLLARWSPVVAISISTLLFAVMHMDSLQHIIAVVPLGLLTGTLAYRTNSTRPGIIVHAAHNTGAVMWGAGAAALSAHLNQETLGLAMIATLVVMFLIGLPAVISVFRRLKPKAAVEAHPVATREPSLPSFGIDSRLVGQMG